MRRRHLKKQVLKGKYLRYNVASRKIGPKKLHRRRQAFRRANRWIGRQRATVTFCIMHGIPVPPVVRKDWERWQMEQASIRKHESLIKSIDGLSNWDVLDEAIEYLEQQFEVVFQ